MRSGVRRLIVPLVAMGLVAALGAPVGPVGAAKGSKWTKLSAGKVVNFFEPALFRDAAGVLHVLWPEQGASDRYKHVKISKPGSKSGAVGTPVTALAAWESLGIPALISDGTGGMRALFSGLRSTEISDPYASGAVYHMTSDGASWTLGSGSLSQDNHAYGSTAVGGTLAPSGPMASWSWTGGVYTHAGIDPSNPATMADVDHQDACCGYHSNLATDTKTGETFLVWYSNATDKKGIWFRQIAPTLTKKVLLPGSRGDKNSAINPSQRLPIVERSSGGIFVAYCTGYPTCKKVRVLRTDDMKKWDMSGSGGAESVALSRGAGGRLWVTWAKDEKIYVKSSNKKANSWGKTKTIKPPKGTTTIWSVTGEGSAGNLDLIVNLTKGGKGAFWHRRISL